MVQYESIDENAVARALQEPNPLFPLIAMVHHSLIQFSQRFVERKCCA